jgi:hypothetical protein
MTDIAVIIRSTRDGEFVFGCDLTIPIFGRAIVVAMTDFDRLQSSGSKPWNEMIHCRQSGMGHGHEPSGLARDGDYRFRHRPAAWNKGRPAGTQQPRECVITIACVPFAHECVG